MRCQVLVAMVFALAVGSADARSRRRNLDEPVTPPAHDFWSEVIEPNGAQVTVLLNKARSAMRVPDENMYSEQTDYAAIEQRLRYYRDAYNILRAARKLSPENTEVLESLGRAADEIGKTKEAIEALETSVHLTGPDKAKPEVTGLLGAIYLRLGQTDAAIRWLRMAQGPLNDERAPALVHLAHALAARGETSAAIDVLSNAIPQQAFGDRDAAVTLVTFALAVIYDRDEQRAAAFDVLDHLQANNNGAGMGMGMGGQSFGQLVQQSIAKMRFAPAADQHYYQALLYEAQNRYVEARAEWAHYAAAGDSPWRARALDHIAAIDAGRHAVPAKPLPPGALPPPVIHRKIPRP